jgi:hypothetical protein
MNLEKLVAVSGMSGLFRVTANRANGLIVEELGTEKKIFIPARKHQFTPLESIGIYTADGETAPLNEVLQKMLDNQAEFPPIDADASPNELRHYFEQILPDYDADRVYISDIKKIVKWFGILHKHGMLDAEPAGNNSEEE